MIELGNLFYRLSDNNIIDEYVNFFSHFQSKFLPSVITAKIMYEKVCPAVRVK